MKKLFKNLKKLIAFVAIAVFGISSAAFAAPSVNIEGMNLVRNATNNETTYHNTATAKAGDTLRVMAWYHNKENENSGKNAQGLNVRLELPVTENTSHISKMVITGSNTNTVSETAVITTATSTRLEYVPGSATRRHNTGTNATPNWVTESVSDSIVNGGFQIPTMLPCFNFEESIVVTVRVVEVPAPTPTPTPTPTPVPTPPVVITGKGNPLPTSGPAEAAAGAAGLTAASGAGYVWLKSKKALLSALTKIK